MNQYVTGALIKRLREQRKMTQLQLAEKLNVTDKAISKWETGRGYPDITFIEPLSSALGVSVAELFSGNDVVNTNRTFNMMKLKAYVCPVCGNFILSPGEAVVSCCGLELLPLEAEEEYGQHSAGIERIEDEYYVTIDHPMGKEHYISFIAAIRDDGYEIRKLYPEGDASAYFRIRGTRFLYYYCNKHGLFKVAVK